MNGTPTEEEINRAYATDHEAMIRVIEYSAYEELSSKYMKAAEQCVDCAEKYSNSVDHVIRLRQEMIAVTKERDEARADADRHASLDYWAERGREAERERDKATALLKEFINRFGSYSREDGKAHFVCSIPFKLFHDIKGFLSSRGMG